MSAILMGLLFVVWAFFGLVGMLVTLIAFLVHRDNARLVVAPDPITIPWWAGRKRKHPGRDHLLHLAEADKLIESVGGTVRK